MNEMNRVNHQSDPREGYPSTLVLVYYVIRLERSCGETREYVLYVTTWRALAERYIDEHTTGEECLIIEPKFLTLGEYIELSNLYFWAETSK